MSMVIDGEAPETDDEIENENEEEIKKQIPIAVSPPVEKISAPINKNLQKHWNQAANDLINVNNRRLMNQNKQIIKITDQAANCFTNMQNVAARMNTVHENLTRLEDSVADLLEASQLLPDILKSAELDIPNLY